MKLIRHHDHAGDVAVDGHHEVRLSGPAGGRRCRRDDLRLRHSAHSTVNSAASTATATPHTAGAVLTPSASQHAPVGMSVAGTGPDQWSYLMRGMPR